MGSPRSLLMRESADEGGLSLPICARRQRGRTGQRSASEMGVSREPGQQRGLHGELPGLDARASPRST